MGKDFSNIISYHTKSNWMRVGLAFVRIFELCRIFRYTLCNIACIWNERVKMYHIAASVLDLYTNSPQFACQFFTYLQSFVII